MTIPLSAKVIGGKVQWDNVPLVKKPLITSKVYPLLRIRAKCY
jgi:hypothetical protein